MKKVIGLDIGGTKITGVVFDGKKVLDVLTIVTPKILYDFERNLVKLTDYLSVKRNIAGIGIGMAGLVDPQTGKVKYSPNIKFVANLNLVKFFKLNGIKNVKIDNDANCFTRAELALGEGRKFKNFLALTLGTGIGGGIVIDGRLYRGQNNFGGELGYSLVSNGFLENAFVKARQGRDNLALGQILGQAFGQLINIFAPEAIILGGGVATDKSRNFISLAKIDMRKYLFNKDAKPQIFVSKLNNAGAVGAALLHK